MPYIKQEHRPLIDEAVEELVSAITVTKTGREGCVNYAVTTLLHDLYEASYADYNAAIGVLECIKLELYRRLVVPYENDKIDANGAVRGDVHGY